MATLTIQGRDVQIDDSFMSAPKDVQDKVVADIASKLNLKPPTNAGLDMLESGGTGLLKAFTTNLAGLPGDIQSLGKLGVEKLSGLTGGVIHAPTKPVTGTGELPTSAELEKKVYGDSLHKPETGPGRYTESVAEMLGPMGWIGRGTRTAKAIANVAAGVGAQAGEDFTGGSPWGRFVGGTLGSLSPKAAVRAASPLTAATPEINQAADRLIQRGIMPSAGQRLGSTNLQWAEGWLGNTPMAGGAARAFEDRAQRAFNRNLFQSAGFNFDRPTQQNVNTMLARLNGDFDAIKGRTLLVVDPTLVAETANPAAIYHSSTPQGMQIPLIQRIADEIQNRQGQMISGEDYQSWRKQLSAAGHEAIQETRTSERGRALLDMAEALDNAMERTLARANSPDLGRFRELRRQWGNAMTIIDAIGTGDKANDFDVRKLAQAVKSRDPVRYARGQGDLAQLARDADLVMQQLPEGRRNWWYVFHAIAAVGTLWDTLHGGTSASWAGPVIAAEPQVGRVLMSSPVQRYLGNQAAVGLRDQVPGLASSVLRGGIAGLDDRNDPLAPGGGR